jgi:hypothetical protein
MPALTAAEFLLLATLSTSDPNRPVTCPLYLFWYTLYLKNYKLTILGNRVKQVGFGRESFLATDPPPSILLLSHNLSTASHI